MKTSNRERFIVLLLWLYVALCVALYISTYIAATVMLDRLFPR